MINIEEEWERFVEHAFPEGCSAEQHQEMRRVFYAGVANTLVCLCQLSEQDEDRGADALEDMHRQCKDFFERVKIGAA